MQKNCKHCSVELTPENSAKKNARYYRNECKPCRVILYSKYRQNNLEKCRKYAVNYSRKTGLVKQYPCITCSTLCYKTYAKAFCSVKCRFMHYVEKTNFCWLWKGGKNRNGYGKFLFNNQLQVASRVAYVLFKDNIDTNMLVCHTCDITSCVNPDHLWLGTNSDNQIDSIKKGRHRWSKKERLHACI